MHVAVSTQATEQPSDRYNSERSRVDFWEPEWGSTMCWSHSSGLENGILQASGEQLSFCSGWLLSNCVQVLGKDRPKYPRLHISGPVLWPFYQLWEAAPCCVQIPCPIFLCDSLWKQGKYFLNTHKDKEFASILRFGHGCLSWAPSALESTLKAFLSLLGSCTPVSLTLPLLSVHWWMPCMTWLSKSPFCKLSPCLFSSFSKKIYISSAFNKFTFNANVYYWLSKQV